MNRKKSPSLTISAVGFIAAFLVDLYLIIVTPQSIEIIIAISLIVIVDTYFLVEGILNKIDDIASVNIDKQNELTKVEKGIYSVAKREEISRNQSMSAILDMLLDLKDENARLMNQLIEQENTMSKVTIKKDMDNTNKIVNSNERIAVLLAQSATANAKSQEEALDILNDICKELEQRNGKYEEEDLDQQYSHLKVMK
jgi:formate dehydrogenase assembly factor FdhD